MRALFLTVALLCGIIGGVSVPPSKVDASTDPPRMAQFEASPSFETLIAKADTLAELPAPAVKTETDFGCFTYPVRFRGYSTEDGKPSYPLGSAVAIGDGKFITAAHGAKRLQPGYVVEFKVGETWHAAKSMKVDHESDILEATTDKHDVDGVEVRKQHFGEPVTVYGLTTHDAMKGRAYHDTVGLEPSEHGVQSGDSGGGVFGEDGKLVGLVSGHSVGEHRTVMIARLGEPKTEVASTSPSAPAMVAPRAIAPKPAGVVCRNGQCWRR